MDIIELIRYLNSADGPHMPLRAIAPYVGMDQSQLIRYINGNVIPREETRKQLEQGIRELLKEIGEEGKWLL